VADGSVLAGGVTSLKDHQQRSTIFRVHEVLEVAEFIGQHAEPLLGLVTIQPHGFEAGVNLIEIDRCAGLDTAVFGVAQRKPHSSISWSVIDQELVR